jgi:hypothetical protein
VNWLDLCTLHRLLRLTLTIVLVFVLGVGCGLGAGLIFALARCSG